LKNLHFCDSIGDQNGLASSYNNLGNLSNEQGNYAKALEYYTAASKIFLQMGNEHDHAITLANIGMIQSQPKFYQSAINYFADSREIAARLEVVPIISWLDMYLGLTYKYLQKYASAIIYYNKALVSYQKQGNKHETRNLYRNLGNVHLEMGSIEEA